MDLVVGRGDGAKRGETAMIVAHCKSVTSVTIEGVLAIGRENAMIWEYSEY